MPDGLKSFSCRMIVIMMLSVQSFLSILPLVLLSIDFRFEGKVGPAGMKPASLSALLVVAWSTLMKGIDANQEVEKHLEMGKKMLAAGQLADALSHYHAAVDGDPTNYMTYFRRATVYLALGKSKSALPDLDKVIELKPDFTAARIQRANVKLKQGKLHDAEVDYQEVLSKDSSHAEAQERFQLINPVRSAVQEGKQLFEQHDYTGAIHKLSPIIEVCPWDPDLRELRAECYIAQGDFYKAIQDIRPTTKLRSDNTKAYLKLSTLHYEMGDAEESLNQIRECLKLDPDHKECYAHYKKVKKLDKQIKSVHSLIQDQRWDDCLSKVDQMLDTESETFSFTHKASTHKCKCHSKAQHIKEAFAACNQVLEVDENSIDALCDRAEAYIANEQFEEAVEDYKKASSIDENLRWVQDGLKRAEKLLKQSKKRDYYKILGVKRNAKKKKVPTATLR